MKTARLVHAGAVLVAALCVAARAHAAPSIAEFAADTDFSYPTLSPDGSKVAFVTRVQELRVLVVLDLVKRERRAIMRATNDTFELTWCGFKTNERLLCGFSGTEFDGGQPYPVSRLVAIDVAGTGKPKVLVQNGNHGQSQFQDRIMDWQIDDPKHVYIQLTGDTDGPFPTVYALDVFSGLTSVVQRGRTPILRWSTDRKGVVRFGSGYDEKRSTYITRDSADDKWRTLGKWELGQDHFDVVGFGAAPGTLLVEASHNGRSAIFEMDLSEKSDRQLLFSNAEVDVGGPIYWPADHRIIGFSYATDRSKRMLFDEEAARIYDAIDVVIPNAENYVVDSSRDGKKLLIASQSDVRPSEYYVLDLTDRKLSRIGSANPALAKTPLAPMTSINIKAPDGRILPGYLTLPLGSGGKKVPTIVYPHGGPYARDGWGFDPMVQFMASRGYAVIQVNFRGSTGYGDEWYEAGLRNWGTVMVDDITAATKWAISEGIADPAHTCIVGWSYGGYAALMSAVREADLYKCVVSIAGVSDLRALANEERRFYGGRFRAKYSIGDDTDELKAGSPLRATEKIKAPVLLVHGDDDVQVAVDHSRRMARALDKEKKKHELVIIKDGNHSLSRYEWRETLLTKLEAFLAANN
ncbi:MAG TPA: S9 family peptidase [Steroidobacteraceae bacterium]|nr:S9 family peptidase [Steroidobacteraceae bacterium]